MRQLVQGSVSGAEKLPLSSAPQKPAVLLGGESANPSKARHGETKMGERGKGMPLGCSVPFHVLPFPTDEILPILQDSAQALLF